MRGYVAAGLVTALWIGGTAAAKDPVVVQVGSVPALSAAPLYIAKEKGYFAELGLDVKLQYPGSPSDMAALLSTNQLQFAGTALSAGLFNLMERKVPVTLVLSRGVSPINHFMMVRPGLKDVIKTPSDLKGRVLAIDGRGSGIMYEMGKVLERGNLIFADVELKYFPMSQMATALGTGAIDAAVLISPFQDIAESKGLAVKWLNADSVVTPQPMLSSVLQMNTDWAAAHREAAESVIFAALRGVRDYCNAYHHASTRIEIARILAKYSDANDAALIDRIEWGAMDIDGRIFEDSLMDIQAYYLKQGLIARKLSMQELGPPDWVAAVRARLPSFQLLHDDGTPGCR